MKGVSKARVPKKKKGRFNIVLKWVGSKPNPQCMNYSSEEVFNALRHLVPNPETRENLKERITKYLKYNLNRNHSNKYYRQIQKHMSITDGEIARAKY